MSKWAEYRAWKTTGGKTSSQQPHPLRHRITRRQNVSGRAVLLPTHRTRRPAKSVKIEGMKVLATINRLTNRLRRRKVEATRRTMDKLGRWVQVGVADDGEADAGACHRETVACAAGVDAIVIADRRQLTIAQATVRHPAVEGIRRVSARRDAIRMFRRKNAR